MAVMLSPEESALVIFGSLLDSRVHEAAKSLADESHFTVMIRPLKDDPTKKWSSETNVMKSEEQYTDSFDSGEEDDASIPGSDNETEITESDLVSPGLGSGIYRLRGGADNRTEKTTPAGPPHHLDIDLQLRVDIICQTKFTCHTQYREDRPQVISSTKLTVSPDDLDVQPDRSYSRIGFLAHGYISYWKVLPFDQHIPPNNRTKPAAVEIIPEWIVAYKEGPRKRSADQSYLMQEVSYTATDDQQDRMEVKFSMGIDVDKKEQETEYPKSYIPDIQTDTQHRIREHLVVDATGDSVDNAVTTDPEMPVEDTGPLSVSLSFPATQEKSTRFTGYLGFHNESLDESQLLTVPLLEIRSRGWDIRMEQWRKPVLSNRALSIGNMKSQTIPGISEATQREQGSPSMGADDMETQDMMEEERSTHNSTKSKGKGRDPALRAEGPESNIQDRFAHNTLPSRKRYRDEVDGQEPPTQLTDTPCTQGNALDLDDVRSEGTWEQVFNCTKTTSFQATHMALPQLTGSAPIFHIYTQSTTFSNITGKSLLELMDLPGGFGGPGGSVHTGGEGGEGEGPRLERDLALNSRNASGGTGGIGETGTNIGGKGGNGEGPVITFRSPPTPSRQEEPEEFPRS
ncbi:hypothetical protein C8R45DRAFT_928085 [Mycena sanguinolenta]|nr:hypothetical protein C8R45DRAFT_928085 [Mycena sanguinolenta]